MATILKATLKVTLLAWLVSGVMAWVLLSHVVGAGLMMAVLGVSFGIASLVGIVTFAMLSFQHLREAPLPAAGPPADGPHAEPAPPDYRGFLTDLAMATACGIVVGIAVYLVMRQFVPPPPKLHYGEAPDPARIVPGIAGVLVFLAVFFRRLVLHMFPGAKVPQARALAGPARKAR